MNRQKTNRQKSNKWLWAAVIVLMAPGIAEARENKTLAGPFPARVLNILDGDTLDVNVRTWLNQSIETLVRLEGVDAPESRGRCPEETALALQATQFLESKLGTYSKGFIDVTLYDVRNDKFSGRVIAKVATKDVPDLSRALIDGGFARPYTGGPRLPWCPP
jgi:endonuclease YncB( thermonuclease family)